MLNSRLIAIQGIGFTPIYVAVQGLIEALEEEAKKKYAAEVEIQVEKPRKWYVKRNLKELHQMSLKNLNSKKQVATLRGTQGRPVTAPLGVVPAYLEKRRKVEEFDKALTL